MGFIYKITNDINGKVYIGKTGSTIKERFQEHKKASKKTNTQNRPLYRAINKYGIEHFHIEEVEECSNDILSEREIYWIDYYNSYHSGYNATLGGEGSPIYDYEAIKNFLLKCPYAKECADEFHCDKVTVSKIAKIYNIKLLNKDIEEKKKTVYQYSKDKKTFIQSFDSTADAGRWLAENHYAANEDSGVRSHVGQVARGIRKSAYGFYWSYTPL